MSTGPIDAFRASLKRCLVTPGFLREFYEVFSASSGEVREKFRDTDLDRQARVVADSLYIMAVAAQSKEDSVAWAEMARLAERHGHLDRNVRPELYDGWLSCLLQTAGKYDPQFSPEIEAAWRETLAPGIEFMRSRY
jgi:hemoglobin-like flavoprotein